MLLVGRSGTDLSNFGINLAGMLLCDATNDNRPCSACSSCQLVSRGLHPDLHVISTEEAEDACDPQFKHHSMRYADLDSVKTRRTKTLRSIITVDQIRAVTGVLEKSAGMGASKICIIYPAEALNLNAANALLKALEEPADGTYFLLLSSLPGNLPQTIRSRCSRMDLNNPTNVESLDWLTNVHDVDLKIAQQLITRGFGPHEILQMHSKGKLEAYQTLVDGISDLLSGDLSAGTFARQYGSGDIGLTLKVLQWEIYRGLKGAVQSNLNPEVPVIIPPELAIEFRDVLFSTYNGIGRFLNLPKKSVDQQLFLEYIVQKICCIQAYGPKI